MPQPDDEEEKIRQEAHRLWEAEGRPEGRAERHWAEAKEILALRTGFSTTQKPLDATLEEPAEPTIAFEGQADVPGPFVDTGEAEPGPSLETAHALAAKTPLSTEATATAAPQKRKRA